ncbi:Neur-chan-LBD domain-containing protein [Aphelenchoides fujianensis]|nr:Neur-chan-LBD domain-containing protein [Aphelenchoides fujianensis]
MDGGRTARHSAAARRWSHRRRRRLLVALQLVCVGLTFVAAVAQERVAEQPPTTTTTVSSHPHRHHAARRASEQPTSTQDVADSPADHVDLVDSGRSVRSVYDPAEANSRSLRRKETPVNYRLYDDLLRNYNKAARPVRHPNQVIRVSASAFMYQIFKLVSSVGRPPTNRKGRKEGNKRL